MLSMKKILYTLILLSFSLGVSAQAYKMYETQNIHNQLRLNTKTGTVEQIQDDGQKWIIVQSIEANGSITNRFELFETRNMWTFILLDTFDGRIWQVQYSTKSVEEMLYIPINSTPLVSSKSKRTFTIQPLTSMYQYYLLNEDNGEIWKFQWSTKGAEYRWIEKM